MGSRHSSTPGEPKLAQQWLDDLMSLTFAAPFERTVVIDPEHDPEKCAAVFRKDHAQTITSSVIRKSVQRFSDKIMLKPSPEAR
jgi:hypothetical protein